MLIRALVITLIAGALNCAICRAQPAVPADKSYELRVYLGGIPPQPDQEPQIKTGIKIGKLFFARSDGQLNGLPDSRRAVPVDRALYIASGVLHVTREGELLLEHTCLVWWSASGNFSYGGERTPLVLNQPHSEFSSDGFIHGYTLLLSKVSEGKGSRAHATHHR